MKFPLLPVLVFVAATSALGQPSVTQRQAAGPADASADSATAAPENAPADVESAPKVESNGEAQRAADTQSSAEEAAEHDAQHPARNNAINTPRPSNGAKRSAAATSDAPAAGEEPAETRPVTREKALPADQMLGRMLKPRPTAGRELKPTQPPAADKTSGAGAVKPDAPVLTVMREGTFLVNRVGRLTRSADGSQAEFTFEADGQALRDPPLIILPNLKLMTMEDAVKGANRDLRFRVTGMVTEYRGRNYVMLEKVQVVQDVTQQFRQQP